MESLNIVPTPIKTATNSVEEGGFSLGMASNLVKRSIAQDTVELGSKRGLISKNNEPVQKKPQMSLRKELYTSGQSEYYILEQQVMMEMNKRKIDICFIS